MVAHLFNKTLAKVFGSRNERLIKVYQRRVLEINVLEPAIRKLTDAQMRSRVEELKKELADGKSEQDVLPEAFALMREAMDRHIGLRNALTRQGSSTRPRFPPKARACIGRPWPPARRNMTGGLWR